MKRLILIFSILLAAISVQANYSIFSVTGKVTVMQKGQKIAAVKDMKLNASDQIEIAPGAKVEIYNAATKEIFSSEKVGMSSVMGIMLDARKQASNTAGAINDRMRFGASVNNPQARIYTEGLVTRSMQVYDPEADSLIVEPRVLAMHIVNALQQPEVLVEKSSPDSAPVTHSHNDNGGLQFRVQNALSFPIYINVIKINAAKSDEVEISELGQPMGSYVVLPDQAITREHFSGLDSDENHILVMTHCRFDIDELIEQVNMIMADKNSEQPDTDLPVYLIQL